MNTFIRTIQANKKAVLSQGNRVIPQLFIFGLKFADNIHYKFKSNQGSKASRLQSSKHGGTKQNLTKNGHSRSSKVTCFYGVSGKAIRDYVLLHVNTNVGLIY